MRRSLARLLFTLACLVPLAVSAQEPRDPANYFIYSSLTGTTDCDGFLLNIVAQSDGLDAFVGTLFKANGVYMDESTGGFSGSDGNFVWGLGSANDRGLQNRSFPMPKNTPMTAESTMFDSAYSPLYRSRVSFSRCNNGAITRVQNFEPFSVQAFGSFDIAAVDPSQPFGWTPSASVASSTSGRDCVVTLFGPCSLRLVPDVNAKSQSYRQPFSYTGGLAGKRVELAAFQRLENDFQAYDTITVTLKFKNGQFSVLELNTEKHAGDAEWKYGITSMAMPAPLVKATMKITLKGKHGGAWNVDGLSVTVWKKSNVVPVVRSAPLALPPVAN